MEKWQEQFATVCFQRSSDTAHDLKTPLNIAVLNLELLRMRAKRLCGGDEDEKILVYARAIESELRRMARIFDAFFINSVPPKSGAAPVVMDIDALLEESAGRLELKLSPPAVPSRCVGHEQRFRELAKLFLDGTNRVFVRDSLTMERKRDGDLYVLTATGRPVNSEIEIDKLLKFYYTDPAGNADLSLATARLIAETVGGNLQIERDQEMLRLELKLPLDKP